MVAEDPVMQFVAADWLKSNKREDHLASRPSHPIQKFLANQVNHVICLNLSFRTYMIMIEAEGTKLVYDKLVVIL